MVDSSRLSLGTLVQESGDQWRYRLDGTPPALDMTEANDRLSDRAQVTWMRAGREVASTSLEFQYLRPWREIEAVDDELWVYHGFQNRDEPIWFRARIGRNDRFGPRRADEAAYAYVFHPSGELETLWSTIRFPGIVAVAGGSRYPWQDLLLEFSDFRYDVPGEPYTMGGTDGAELELTPLRARTRDTLISYELCPPYPIVLGCEPGTLTVHERQPVEARPDRLQVAPGDSGAIDLLANDTYTDTPDQPATVSVAGLPDDVEVVLDDERVLHVTAPAGRDGTGLAFTVEVRDFTGRSRSTGWLQIGEPRAPVAKDDRIGARAGREVLVDVLANDVHAALATVRARSSRFAKVEVHDDGRAAIRLTRAAARKDAVRIPYTLTDGTGLADEAVIVVAVRR